MTEQTKGHPHAALMLEYAKDAAEHAEPWLLWEREAELERARFVNLKDHPDWHPKLAYRRKPRTIRIGEHEVPEPLREAPETSIRYYVATDSEEELSDSFIWAGDKLDSRFLRRGLIHLSREAAEAHARALIAVSGGQP